jgi:hypothetical protein
VRSRATLSALWLCSCSLRLRTAKRASPAGLVFGFNFHVVTPAEIKYGISRRLWLVRGKGSSIGASPRTGVYNTET